jgi:transposase-like protein
MDDRAGSILTTGHRTDSTGRRNTSITEVRDGTRQEAVAGAAGGCTPAVGGGSGVAAADASPGRPEPSRAVQREFWRLIAGGMPPRSLDEPTGRYLSFAEREEIALLRAQDAGVRQIARRLGRDPGTISRELRRNAATRSGKRVYRAVVAQWKAQQAAKRPKTAKLAGNGRLREYVQERLSGSVRRPGGAIVAGPKTPAPPSLSGRLPAAARSQSQNPPHVPCPMAWPCTAAGRSRWPSR